MVFAVIVLIQLSAPCKVDAAASRRPPNILFILHHTNRVVRDQRFKLSSSGRFHDLAAAPLELHDLSEVEDGPPREAVTARSELQSILDSLPSNTERPFTFRSISARKIRAKADADRHGKWVRREHEPPDPLKDAFRVPPEFQEDGGPCQSPLVVEDGQRVETARQWQRRRAEILSTWHEILGPWPDLIEKPRVESVNITRRGEITQRRVRIEVGLGGEMVEGFLLIPDGDGPFPAVLVVYYDAQTGVGRGTKRRDFAWQLARRGFVTLSIGKHMAPRQSRMNRFTDFFNGG